MLIERAKRLHITPSHLRQRIRAVVRTRFGDLPAVCVATLMAGAAV